MENKNLSEQIRELLKTLNFSDKLTEQAIADLEKIVAIRYYNRLVSILPDDVVSVIPNDQKNYEEVIHQAEKHIAQDILEKTLLQIVREVITEYFEAVTE